MATPVKALTIFTIGTCLALNSCALAAGTDVLDEYLGKNAQLLRDFNVTKISRAPDDVRPEDHHVALGETYVRINAALQISSTRRGFGGWSSILTNKQGTALLAVSDVGVWLEADLTFNTTTDIVSNLASVKMSPMRNITADGSEEGIAGNKEWGDAETLTSETGGSLGDDDGGAVLVSFERRHRIWKYTKDVDGPVPHPVHPGVSAIFSQCKLNGGVEAAEVLRDGRLFAVCEHPEPGSPHEDHVPGWIFTNWEGSKGDFGVLPIWLPLDGSFFGMTDLARLPPHGEHEEHEHLLLLSRAHVEVCDDCVMHGSAMRLSRVHVPRIGMGGGVLKVELLTELWASDGYPIDNMEGLTVIPGRPKPPGVDESVLEEPYATAFVISDDNFNPAQRTLLLQVTLTSALEAPAYVSEMGRKTTLAPSSIRTAPPSDGVVESSDSPKGQGRRQSRTAVFVLVGGGVLGIMVATALLAADYVKEKFRRRELYVRLDEVDE